LSNYIYIYIYIYIYTVKYIKPIWRQKQAASKSHYKNYVSMHGISLAGNELGWPKFGEIKSSCFFIDTICAWIIHWWLQ